MKSVIFDTNIYDLLADDFSARDHIVRLIELGLLKVIVTRTIWEELSEKPFFGIPNFFPIEYTGNTVGACGVCH